jgi:mono/diheme cytochrome c family protein
MKINPMKPSIAPTVTFALVAGAFLIAGCASPPAAPAGRVQNESGPSGARLWAQNCTRCHNSRPPSDYSGAHWEVAMLHMRVRANLTAEEHRKILEFLQTGN